MTGTGLLTARPRDPRCTDSSQSPVEGFSLTTTKMRLLKSLSVRNFKCFRGDVTVDFAQASYLIGANNSGKTSLLSALRCFFDDSEYSSGFLNKTERAGRREGAFRSDITVTFDLSAVPQKVRRKRLTDEFGPDLVIRKSFALREISGLVDVEYTIGKKQYTSETLPAGAREILNAVSISYIHPQEGSELLRKAQDKFKQRLFQNWGRHASVADRVKAVQVQWEGLRKLANTYLSSTLTERLRDIWPGSDIKVDLPERIDEIVAISDISFRSAPSQPEVTLPAHGTGAQSTVLYHTHYLLDSDRTLHRGLYFPIWLLEEPESFLHADIAIQLGRLLSSSEWLNAIQMIVSTHSPIILAGSRQSADITTWVTLEAHAVSRMQRVSEVGAGDIRSVGVLMGDSNFDVYFSAARRGPLIYLEDSRPLTRERFIEAGIPIAEGLDGVSEIKKYLTVLPAISSALRDDAIAIADRDRGARDLKHIIESSKIGRSVGGWQEYVIAEKVRLLLLPEGAAVEDLFDAWDDELETALDEIYDRPLKLKSHIPADLSRAVGVLRKLSPATRAEAKDAVRVHQDVKDRFWHRVQIENLPLSAIHAAAVKDLIANVNS